MKGTNRIISPSRKIFEANSRGLGHQVNKYLNHFVMKRAYVFIFSVLLAIGTSCEEPVDPIIEAVDEAGTLLQRHVWNLEDLTIKVRNEDIPPPILFSFGDSLIKSFKYDLDDLALDASDMRETVVIFDPEERKIISSSGSIDVIGDSIGSYFIFNDQTIRITTSKFKLNYSYIFDEQEKTLALTLSSEQAGSIISDYNEKLLDAISGQTPNKIGDLIAKLIYNNEPIQRLLNELVVSALAGQLEFINDFDPGQVSEELAARILEALGQIDWEKELTDLLRTELEKITNIDPDQVAAEIAAAVAERINESLSTDNIRSIIFPFIDQIATNPDQTADAIAKLIIGKFLEVFDEQTLRPIVFNAWDSFTRLDEEQITTVAGTLTTLIENSFINQDNLTGLFLPTTQRIDETSLFQLGALAQEATDNLEVLVNNLNVRFPDLNLEPDYESMQNSIRAIFIAAKPVIGLVGGPERAAEDVANLILSQFLSSENINQFFISALTRLQDIDPEVAANAISTWLSNLAEEVSPEIIVYLSDFLSPILDNIDPQATSLRIAEALNSFIQENVTPEAINGLILPLVEAISNINADSLAKYLAQKILQLEIIEDVVNEENIAAIILPVLTAIKETNVDNLAQDIVNAIVKSGIFEDTITEDRVATIISLLIYTKLWEDVKIANNFEEVTILLSHD